jgi:hypothetical protein
LQEGWKTRIFTPAPESSGQSRLEAFSGEAWAGSPDRNAKKMERVPDSTEAGITRAADKFNSGLLMFDVLQLTMQSVALGSP